MKNRVHLVELEPVETRYTAEWKNYLPKQLEKSGLDVNIIKGPEDAPQDTTPGAFLNFSGTNYWKSEQLKTISQMFANGEVVAGDYFLYTDAWNPTVIQLKYMSELLGIPVRIGGMWHAGSYDPQDFLGRLIGDQPWVRNAEASMFYTFDDNYFATEFHIDMFVKTLFGEDDVEKFKEHHKGKIHRVGWPMEYLDSVLDGYANKLKKNRILFPHRLAPEKQLDIFKDLAKHMPDVEFIVCQEKSLTKKEYHDLLGSSKIVFSANTQETLGISCYEGALVGAMPLVPDRLSYTEMYPAEAKYPSEWTENWDSYVKNRKFLITHVRKTLLTLETQTNLVYNISNNLRENFFSGTEIYKTILENFNNEQ